MSESVKYRTSEEVTTYYHWTCPKCWSQEMVSSHCPEEPPWNQDEDFLWCNSCLQADYEQKKDDYISTFKRLQSWLIGAKIVSIDPWLDEIWEVDSNPEWADTDRITIRLKDGRIFDVRSSTEEPWLIFKEVKEKNEATL